MRRPLIIVATPPTHMEPRVLQTVCQLAELLRADVELLVVARPVDTVDPHTQLSPSSEQVADDMRQQAHEAEVALAEPLSEIAKLAHAATLLVVNGQPTQAILARAEAVQPAYLVMGTRGHTGVTRALLGSVAEGVLRRAPCPVVVVPPGAE